MRLKQHGSVKRRLALSRWWLGGFTVALVLIRVAVAAGLGELGLKASGLANGVSAVLAAYDLLCVVMAVATVVAFVQYGRIFNARIPTE